MRTFDFLPFRDFLMEKRHNEGLSERSIIAYVPILELLLNNSYIRYDDFVTYTPQNFKRLLMETSMTRDWTACTYNAYRKYFRVLCGYLEREGLLAVNPICSIPKRKMPKALPKTLTDTQVSCLKNTLRCLAAQDGHFINTRNVVVVWTYLYTGLRLSELLNLSLDDLDTSSGVLRVRHGKGNKDRIVPLPDVILKKLIEYRNIRLKHAAISAVLFPSLSGLALQKRDINRFLSRLRKKLGFHFTWHQLRHTYATMLIHGGINLYTLSRILGHSRTTTTEIYLSFDSEKAREKLQSLAVFSS